MPFCKPGGDIWSRRIAQFGESLCLTRRNGAQVMQGWPKSFVGISQPYSPSDATAVMLENGKNLAESTPYVFIFPTGTDIAVADEIGPFIGFIWIIATIESPRLNGADVYRKCLALRSRPVPG